MAYEHVDIVVIGGGPAGSSLATLLVRQGYQVLLLEREAFPRFHIGESLLPASHAIWEKLGLSHKLQTQNFVYKDAAEFRIGLDPNHSDYWSAYIDFTAPQNWPAQAYPDCPSAYQVERSTFDQLLLDHASEQGVTVCQPATVKQILWQGERATGAVWRSHGQTYTTMAQCIADCSGRQALISRSRQWLQQDPELQTAAVFGHFRGVTPNPGQQQGAITIYFIEHGWVWFIPVQPDCMSVGIVMNAPGNQTWQQQQPEHLLWSYLNRYQYLRKRFTQAEPVSKIRCLHHLSYASTHQAGDGWILVGDANFFVDPLLSSGVQVAFKTAEQAALAIDAFLRCDDLRPMRQYARWGQRYYWHVCVTMRLLYRMMQSQWAMKTFIQGIDENLTQNPHPIVRRFIAWCLGHFDQYHVSLYCLWISFGLLAILGKLQQICLG